MWREMKMRREAATVILYGENEGTDGVGPLGREREERDRGKEIKV